MMSGAASRSARRKRPIAYEGRIAVVTGAASGIGRELTLALVDGGARVAAADVDAQGLAALSAHCPPGRVKTYEVDVANRSAVTQFAAQVRGDLGAASVVINNAGVDLFSSVEDMPWDDFDWLMGINVGGVVNGSKAFLSQLIESGQPGAPSRLINISSAFGLIAVPYQGAYNTSKFAVRGFTETLRQELIIDGHAVTAHCVHPGVVRTNFAKNMRSANPVLSEETAREVFERYAVTTPAKAARRILHGADRNQARIIVGADGLAAAAMPRVLGARYGALIAHTIRLTTAGIGRVQRLRGSG